MARRKKLPVEPFEVEISSQAKSGAGLGRYRGKTLQVHAALPGEAVLARYLFGRRLRGQAQTVEVLTASTDRVEPRCPHFGICSGCSLQHMDNSAQILFKQNILLGLLAKRGGITPETVLPPLVAEQWNYRRKARLSVRHVRGKGRVLVGFRERDGRYVADISECHVLYKPVAERLPELARMVGELQSFDTIPQLEVSCGDEQCALIFRHLEALPVTDLDRLRTFSQQTGLHIFLQLSGPDSIVPLVPECTRLSYSLPDHGIGFTFRPLDFIQVNGSLNRLMVAQAIRLLQPEPGDRVLDLFCGLGNFTLPLARHCAEVYGLEGDPGLVARAAENATANSISNAKFVRADLYGDTVASDWPAGSFQRVLLDPPRSGAGKVLHLIGNSAAACLVYVSCNPVTLATDAAALVTEYGFKLSGAGVMDMFPHTAHVESMAVFERN